MSNRRAQGRRGTGAWGLCAVLVALGVGNSACGAATPQRLDEQVSLFLDDLRWGRMSAAEGAVGGTLRERFARTHARWAERVRIMDVEMETGRVSFTQGVMRLRYVWTGPDGVNIRETIVDSIWRAGPGGSWYLDDERVVAGDASLLPGWRDAPRPANAQGNASSGGSAAPASAATAAPPRAQAGARTVSENPAESQGSSSR